MKLLREGLDRLGIPYTDSQIESFTLYLSELKKWNRAYNLTGLKADRDIIAKNFLDSALYVLALPSEVKSIADVGTGAGFPGIPVKILRPALKTYLVEPTQKKVLFLRNLINKLKLSNVEVIDKRIEDVKDIRVDVVMTRALFSINEFIEKTGHILNENGFLILSKGPKLKEELNGIDKSRVTIKDYTLPFENAVRHLVVVKK